MIVTLDNDAISGFNPRPRMGSDDNSYLGLKSYDQFQSTPPHGERPMPVSRIKAIVSFNPRPRMGSDKKWEVTPMHARVSIHAPAWGATCRIRRKDRNCLVSIHAPAWGATEGMGLTEAQLFVSIHAPAWGATRFLRCSKKIL